jgi:phenylacetic acid degradation protein PaaD
MDGTTMSETEAVKDRMRRLNARDAFPTSLGIEYIEGGLGRAVVRLTVSERHLNCNGSCHGGVIFALGDTAFGLASNSYGAVAAGIDVHITYHVAAKLGDVLTGTATEISRNRKLGVYRIDITSAERGLVASFTGTAFISDRPNDG